MADRHERNEDAYLPLILVGGGAMLLLVVWLLFGNQIAAALLLAAQVLMIPLTWFAPVLTSDYIAAYNEVSRFLSLTGVENFTLARIETVYSWLGASYRWAVCPLLVMLATYLFIRPVAPRYRHALNLQDLIRHNVRYFPQIRPALFHNLIAEDPDQGPFARALDYRLLAERHQLLGDRDGTPVPWVAPLASSDGSDDPDPPQTGNPRHPRRPAPECDPAPCLLMDHAIAVFSAQLGAPWLGLAQLPPFHMALFGVLAARIVEGVPGCTIADKALFQMNATWTERADSNHRMTTKVAARLAARYGEHPEIALLIERHHYTNTLFTALLARARERSGILATADFLWLKVVDRDLWYALNQVGRWVAWPEAAGVRAHYRAEIKARRAIAEPVVGAAVRALAQALVKESYLSPSWNPT